MSLDFYLINPEPTEVQCPYCEHKSLEKRRLYSGNITHNLGEMAREAGIYEHLWRPESFGIKTAKELIEPLEKGLDRLYSDPNYYYKFNAENSWGLYKHFVPFVEEVLKACEEFPEAEVKTST